MEINAVTRHKLNRLVRNLMYIEQSNYSFDTETIGNILSLENCPTILTYWQNLLKHITFDVSFENTSENVNLRIQYKKEDITENEDIIISVFASTKDCIAFNLFYLGNPIAITAITNLDMKIQYTFTTIIRDLFKIMSDILPPISASITTKNSDICQCLETI
jgi:hypothetical protein